VRDAVEDVFGDVLGIEQHLVGETIRCFGAPARTHEHLEVAQRHVQHQRIVFEPGRVTDMRLTGDGGEDHQVAFEGLAVLELESAHALVAEDCQGVRAEMNSDAHFFPQRLQDRTGSGIKLPSSFCKPIDDGGRESVLERFIHGEIYRARPEVMCVVHNHSPSVVPFACTGCEMKPIFHMSACVGLGVPNWDIRDAQRGTAIHPNGGRLSGRD